MSIDKKSFKWAIHAPCFIVYVLNLFYKTVKRKNKKHYFVMPVKAGVGVCLFFKVAGFLPAQE